jgi:hypothetical protein
MNDNKEPLVIFLPTGYKEEIFLLICGKFDCTVEVIREPGRDLYAITCPKVSTYYELGLIIGKLSIINL